MEPREMNVYAACDNAIKAMNRQNLDAFSTLKLAKWDELNIIQVVKAVYTASARRARKRYYEVAFEAYLLALALCMIEPGKAHRMAENAITEKWVDAVLTDVDVLTAYRFDTETERKAYRLAEALEVVPDRNAAIDKALKEWTRQVGQFAINMTDYAMLEAYDDAGILEGEWVTQRDELVCRQCSPLDGRRFALDEVPTKHPHCRCYLIPVLDG